MALLVPSTGPLPIEPQVSPLCTVPREILQRVALEILLDKLIGLSSPKESLTSLICTCQEIYAFLSFAHNGDLYAQVFRHKFDVGAARRRYGQAAIQVPSLSSQLGRWYLTMRIIRTGDIWHVNSGLALAQAWLMMSEDDGRNRAQLQWAGIETFVEKYVFERINNPGGSNDEWESSQGWPVETKEVSTALWLFWAFTTEGTRVYGIADCLYS